MPNLPNGTKGGFEPGLTRLRVRHRPVSSIHKPSDNASLAIDTLLLQMNNGEQVYIINSVYCLSGG